MNSFFQRGKIDFPSMPKLYFRYGAMGSGKTVSLLVAYHQYVQHGRKSAVIIKPAADTRQGEAAVWTRVPGLSREADLVMYPGELMSVDQFSVLEKVDCVFVDEAQFLHPKQVEQLSWLSLSTPVICYGLRTDFRGQLFAGAAALMAWAECIQEVKNVCVYCHSKATHNLKIVCEQRSSNLKEAKIELGADDKYVGVCKACFYLRQSTQDKALGEYRVYEYPMIEITRDDSSKNDHASEKTSSKRKTEDVLQADLPHPSPPPAPTASETRRRSSHQLLQLHVETS